MQVGSDGGRAQRLEEFIWRRRLETYSLLSKTRGVVVILAVPEGRSLNIYEYDRSIMRSREWGIFDFLPEVSGKRIVGNIIDILPREGSTVQLKSRRHPVAQYFSAFEGEIKYQCILRIHGQVEVIAIDKVGEAIAVDCGIEGGRVIFLPPFPDKDARKAGAVMVQVIRRLLGKGIDEKGPDWVTAYPVVRLGNLMPQIEVLERKIRALEGEKVELESEEERLRNFQILLYGQGKYVLEPVVREAFRVLKFDVAEPDTYAEEYDLHLTCAEGRAIGEIEGVDDGPVDLIKYRQLLDYVNREFTEKNTRYKGILVGNGFRKTDPKERRDQFTDAARRGCMSMGFCMITTEQLYYAVNAVLKNPDDESMKARIRKEIVEKVGDWRFGVGV